MNFYAYLKNQTEHYENRLEVNGDYVEKWSIGLKETKAVNNFFKNIGIYFYDRPTLIFFDYHSVIIVCNPKIVTDNGWTYQIIYTMTNQFEKKNSMKIIIFSNKPLHHFHIKAPKLW